VILKTPAAKVPSGADEDTSCWFFLACSKYLRAMESTT
jgi:hypothetical protein